MHDDLKMSAIKLLLSIIEGPVDTDIYRQIADSMDDFQILTKRLEIIFKRFIVEDLGLSEDPELSSIMGSLEKESFQGKITEGFNIFCLINQLMIAMPDIAEKISTFRNSLIFQFFKLNTGNVEVSKDNEIMTIYFPIQPKTKFLTS